MSTTTESGPMDQGHDNIPPALAGPNAPKPPKPSDRPSTWELMRGQRPVEEMHPYWVHVVTASGATLLAGVLLSLMTIAWWGWILTFLLLVCAGGVLGSALTARASVMLNWLGTYTGIAWGAATGGLGLLMSLVQFNAGALDAAARPAWLAWIALSVFGSIVHRWIWGRLAEISDPHHPRGVEYRRRRNGGIWENAFAAAGLGDVVIEDITERWSGMDVIFRTDPNRATSFPQIKNAADKLIDLAHKAFREAGEEEGLGLGEVEVKSLQQRDLFMLRVRTRDPLRETITATIPSREEFRVEDNDTLIHLGFWDTGEDLAVPAAGPHKFAVGTTGSGKSTWLIALQVGYARRPHWTMWAAGTSKLMDLIQPIVDAANAVGGKPLFEMWGGGDGGTTGELRAAERMVTAAYLLYLDRAGRAGRGALSGRAGRNFVGAPDCPWVALFLDEFDNLVKRSGDRKIPLPNGDKKTVWDMLVDLGSKARSYGIELVYATQRTTNTWTGGNGVNRSMNDILTMCNTRFVFRTGSSSAIQDILKNQTAGQKAKNLEHMNFACMASIVGSGNEDYRYGKAELWEDEDLIEITRLANELGTLTTIGPADKAALGDLYVEGAQPVTTGASPGGGTAGTGSAADPAKWGDPDRTEARRRLADELLASSGGPSTSTRHNHNDGEETSEGDGGDAGADRFAGTLAEIANLDTLTQDEVDAIREQYRDRYPETPEEILGAILDAWDDLDDHPAELAAGDMVRRFGLHWLDTKADERDNESAVIRQASVLLGSILQGEPISVAPRKTNRGQVYTRHALQEAYDRITEN